MKKVLIVLMGLAIMFSALSSYASTTGGVCTYPLTFAHRIEVRALFPGSPTFATVEIEDLGDCVKFTVDQIDETLLTPCATGSYHTNIKLFAFNSTIADLTISGLPAHWGIITDRTVNGFGTFNYALVTPDPKEKPPVNNEVQTLTFTVCKAGTDLNIEDFEQLSYLKPGQVAENGLRMCAAHLTNFCVGLYEPDGITPINSAYFAPEGTTLIELSDFMAIPGRNKVTLIWATEAEIDNAGFNIYRADSPDGDYSQINDTLIPAEGSPTAGAGYTFTDKGLQNRTTYYYKLEDVDLNSNSSMHGPVSATPRRSRR